MANTVYKRKFSGSTDGKPILVAATGDPGTTIHTAVAGITAGTYDEIWLWLGNNDSVSHVVTIEMGSTTSDAFVTIPPYAGLFLVLAGNILQNGMVLKLWADVTNKVTAWGYVNTMTDA
jgi:hypothetical protein